MTKTRIVLLVCAMFALTVGVATAIAGGGNSNNAKLCQKDGWKTRYRSEDGTSFNNQGACVSYGAKGGTLTSSVADVSLSSTVGFGGGVAGVIFCATNAGPSAVTITVRSEGLGVLDEEGTPFNNSGEQTATLLPGETKLLSNTHLISPFVPLDAYAQVTAASVHDPDSTPNNYTGGFTGPAVEDDESVVHITGDSVGSDC